MRRKLLISLTLFIIFVPELLALEIEGSGEGFFMSEAHNTAGYQAKAWAYAVDGHLKADPYARADVDHAEASVKGYVSTDNGYAESGTLSTNDLNQAGIGAITNASIEGSGTIGMDYFGSVDINLNYQNASANSANVNAYVNTNLNLDDGSASVDSMARDANGNYARTVALASTSAWIDTSQTVSIDPTSTSASMDLFGSSRDGLMAMLSRDLPPYISAYSGSGNDLGYTSVQYTISKGCLNTEGVVQDASGGYIVPNSPSATSMKAYADSKHSVVNSEGAGKIKLAQNDMATILSEAVSEALGSTKWTFVFEQLEEGELTATASQDALGRSASIY